MLSLKALITFFALIFFSSGAFAEKYLISQDKLKFLSGFNVQTESLFDDVLVVIVPKMKENTEEYYRQMCIVNVPWRTIDSLLCPEYPTWQILFNDIKIGPYDIEDMPEQDNGIVVQRGNAFSIFASFRDRYHVKWI